MNMKLNICRSIFTFQICELTYEKQIDFSTVDLKKLKVKDLKKILSEWDEVNDQKHRDIYLSFSCLLGDN